MSEIKKMKINTYQKKKKKKKKKEKEKEKIITWVPIQVVTMPNVA